MGYLSVGTSTPLPLELQCHTYTTLELPLSSNKSPISSWDSLRGRQQQGTGTWDLVWSPLTVATSREQGVATDPRASPLVTKQLGAWYGPVTPLPPHVLMGASANAESRNVFSSGINATFATHNRQPLLAVKNKLFSPSEGFSLPSNYLIFSNVSQLLMTPGSQSSSRLGWSVQANTPTRSLALKNSVPFQQLPPGYLCTICQ